MTNTADILNLLAGAGGLGVLLVMALVPLLVDHHRPRERAAVTVPARGARAAAHTFATSHSTESLCAGTARCVRAVRARPVGVEVGRHPGQGAEVVGGRA